MAGNGVADEQRYEMRPENEDHKNAKQLYEAVIDQTDFQLIHRLAMPP